jgi:hypothetical protein
LSQAEEIYQVDLDGALDLDLRKVRAMVGLVLSQASENI